MDTVNKEIEARTRKILVKRLYFVLHHKARLSTERAETFLTQYDSSELDEHLISRLVAR